MLHLILTFLIISSSLFAQNSSKLILDLKIQSALLLAETRNQFLSQPQFELNSSVPMTYDDINELTDNLLDDAIDFYPELKNPKTRKSVKDRVKTVTKNIYIHFRAYGRENGMDAAIIYTLGSLIENTIPLVLLSAIGPASALTLTALPVGEAITGSYLLLRKKIKKKRLERLCGGKENFESLQEIESETKSALGIRYEDDILMPVQIRENTHQIYWVLNNRKLKPNTKFISLKRVFQYAKKHGVDKSILKKILQTKEKRMIKQILLLKYLYRTQSAEWLKKLEQRFLMSVRILSFNHFSNEKVTWAKKIDQVKSLSDYENFLAERPSNLSPSEFYYLYHRVFLPMLAKNVSGWQMKWFKNSRRENQLILSH
jgi:hypothetical protein